MLDARLQPGRFLELVDLKSDTRMLVAAAMTRLPEAGPECSPQVIELGLWHPPGRYRITLTACLNDVPRIHEWYWGIEACERIDPGSKALPVAGRSSARLGIKP